MELIAPAGGLAASYDDAEDDADLAAAIRLSLELGDNTSAHRDEDEDEDLAAAMHRSLEQAHAVDPDEEDAALQDAIRLSLQQAAVFEPRLQRSEIPSYMISADKYEVDVHLCDITGVAMQDPLRKDLFMPGVWKLARPVVPSTTYHVVVKNNGQKRVAAKCWVDGKSALLREDKDILPIPPRGSKTFEGFEVRYERTAATQKRTTRSFEFADLHTQDRQVERPGGDVVGKIAVEIYELSYEDMPEHKRRTHRTPKVVECRDEGSLRAASGMAPAAAASAQRQSPVDSMALTAYDDFGGSGSKYPMVSSASDLAEVYGDFGGSGSKYPKISSCAEAYDSLGGSDSKCPFVAGSGSSKHSGSPPTLSPSAPRVVCTVPGAASTTEEPYKPGGRPVVGEELARLEIRYD